MDPQIIEQLKIALLESQQALAEAKKTVVMVEASDDLKMTFKSALKILKERNDALLSAHGEWPVSGKGDFSVERVTNELATAHQSEWKKFIESEPTKTNFTRSKEPYDKLKEMFAIPQDHFLKQKETCLKLQ